MTSPDNERSESGAHLVIAVAVAAVALTALAPLALGRSALLGVALGGSFAVLNVWAIGVIVRAFVRGAGIPIGAFALVKFGGLLLLVWLVLKNGWAGPMSLALGYAALPLGIVVGQLGRAAPARQKV